MARNVRRMGKAFCDVPSERNTEVNGEDTPRRVDVGDTMLLDAINARCVRMYPSEEIGIILDLEGQLNKLEIRDAHRYALSTNHAAELIVALVVAANVGAAHDSDARDFTIRLIDAIHAETLRRGLR